MGVTLGAAAAMIVPSFVIAPSRQPIGLLLLQVLICGAALGIARQGIDVLIVRLVVVSLAAPIGWKVTPLATTSPGCGGGHCGEWVVAGAVFFAFIVAFLMALVAVPVATLRNGARRALSRELRWRGPTSPVARILTIGTVSVALIATWAVLGVPSPA
jgi:hypothetical protein